MRRSKDNSLTSLELQILTFAIGVTPGVTRTFHGYEAARAIGEERGSALVGQGSLYKALARLEDFGLLASRWENDKDEPHPGPRRRLYWLTADGLELMARHPHDTWSGRMVHAR